MAALAADRRSIHLRDGASAICQQRGIICSATWLWSSSSFRTGIVATRSGTLPFCRWGFLDIPRRFRRAGIEEDAEGLLAALSEAGFLRDPSGADAEKLLAQFRDLTWWYTQDEEVQLTPAIATQVMIDMSDPRSQWYGQMRHESVPADHLFGRRLETLTLAVLSQLGASNNWHRIAREWVYGQLAEHELGRQEAEFYGQRSGALASRDNSDLEERRRAGAAARQPGGDPTRSPRLRTSVYAAPGLGDQLLGDLEALPIDAAWHAATSARSVRRRGRGGRTPYVGVGGR